MFLTRKKDSITSITITIIIIISSIITDHNKSISIIIMINIVSKSVWVEKRVNTCNVTN
jgi:hypothetical protein